MIGSNGSKFRGRNILIKDNLNHLMSQICCGHQQRARVAVSFFYLADGTIPCGRDIISNPKISNMKIFFLKPYTHFSTFNTLDQICIVRKIKVMLCFSQIQKNNLADGTENLDHSQKIIYYCKY